MQKKSLRRQMIDRLLATQVRQLKAILIQVGESLEELAQYLDLEEE